LDEDTGAERVLVDSGVLADGATSVTLRLKHGDWLGRLGLLGLLCCLVGEAFAQQAQSELRPGALERLRQDERISEIRKRQERAPDIHLQAPEAEGMEKLPEGEQPCFEINAVKWTGEGAEAFAWLQAAIGGVDAEDSPVGRCLGAKGIDTLHRRAQNLLIERGLITTRVLLEAQDLKTGELTFLLIPGRVGQIVFKGNVSERGRLFTAIPFKRGELVQLRAVEQALENLERAPSVSADIQVAPGESPGESELQVLYEQARSLRGSLSVDDSGLRSTGRYQGGVSLFWDNPAGLNDTFYATLTHNLDQYRDPSGTTSAILHYSVPMGYWAVDLTYSRSQNDQNVAGAFVDYQYRSRQRDTEISLGRVLYRDRDGKLAARLSGFRRAYHNYIDDTEVEVQRRVVGGWGAELRYEGRIKRATLAANVGYRRGTGAFRAIPAPEEAFGEGTSRFKILQAGFSVGAPFMWRERGFHYLMEWRGQWNYTPLMSSDRFMIAGRYTVRGFDGETVLAAERGWLVRNDFAMPLADGRLVPYLGLDYGEVGGATSKWLVGKRLAGMALGVKGSYRGVNYHVFGGAPLYKPNDFKADSGTFGFDIQYSF
jgi:hemolysin activation/secretion protein